MKKHLLITGELVSVLCLVLLAFFIRFPAKSSPPSAENVAIKTIDSQIMADGVVRSQNEVTLHFQTGGKLTYLPFKEGDKIWRGQTIASLDTYALQRQLSASLNSYRIVRNSFDQTQDNFADNVMKAQQTVPYDLYSKANIDKDSAISAALKRLLDQTQAGLDNSVIQVELANYALSMANLTSPITGLLVRSDITTPDQIITPQTSFTIIDPASLVFRANVSPKDINYVSLGAVATIKLNSEPDKTYSGTITHIYPDKTTLASGSNVYQVDILSDELSQSGKYKQDGVVFITNKYNRPVILVPSWLILSGHYIWVMQDSHPALISIDTGDTDGVYTEVTHGLSSADQVIIDPVSIISRRYLLL